jgi:peroxiredoxin
MEASRAVSKSMSRYLSSRALILLGLLVASGLVVALGMEVRGLRADLRSASDRNRFLGPGMYIPRLELVDPDGGTGVIGDARQGTGEILLIYNTTCPFCRSVLPVWMELSERASVAGVAVHGLSLDPARETAGFSAEHHLGFRSLLLETERERSLLRAGAVPQTLVLDQEGRILAAMRGALTMEAGDSLLRIATSAAQDEH